MKIWTLKKGSDRRFRAGHPWVYSNELAESPKGLAPGAPVELRDPGGAVLARGYGNPASLIAFRAVVRAPAAPANPGAPGKPAAPGSAATQDLNPALPDPFDPAFLAQRLKQALHTRELAGLADYSHRLSFGEADGLPGLIIDCFATDQGQVYVWQPQTAGAEQWTPSWETALRAVAKDWAKTAVILRSDSGARKLEGLEDKPPQVLKAGKDLNDAQILVAPATGSDPVRFSVDLLEGQKTGFFLDQAANIKLLAPYVAQLAKRQKRIKILDLCCYVGQWGTQLARVAKLNGATDIEVVAVDASQDALARAKLNIEREKARCTPLKGDVIKGVELADHSFDIVISDPPALIKGRKDLPTGTHAYMQLHTRALKALKPGGVIAACSCSGLLPEEDFAQTLAKAARRTDSQVRWVARGTQSPDHPLLAEFPEGRYLKSWIGITHQE